MLTHNHHADEASSSPALSTAKETVPFRAQVVLRSAGRAPDLWPDAFRPGWRMLWGLWVAVGSCGVVSLLRGVGGGLLTRGGRRFVAVEGVAGHAQ